MPRIPSAADVSPVGAGAGRLPAVRAGAEDFGLTTAQALAGLGRGVAAVQPLAEEILRKEKQREEAEQATDRAAHRAELRAAANDMVDRWQHDGSLPRAAARQASEDLAALEETRLKGLSPAQQAAARQATVAIREGHGLRVAQRVQNLNVQALSRKTAATLQLLQGQAMREPAAAERYAAEGTTLLRSLRTAGALTPEQFAAQDEAFRRGLHAAVIQGRPAVDAVADLEAGVYDAVLGDGSLKTFLLTQAKWRLQSEQAQAAAAAEALVEGARRGAVEQAALGQRNARLLAPGALADAERQVARARRVRERLERLRFAPEAELRQEIADRAPVPDATDAVERVELQQETRIQAEAMLRERRHDPAAYVMSQPAVAEAFAAAGQDPALLGDAVAARLAAQAAMALPQEDRRALTRDEGAGIVAGLAVLAPAERAAALQDLARHYGDQGGRIAAELAEAGLSPLESLLLDADSDPGALRKLTQLLDRQHQGARESTPAHQPIAEAADALLADA